METESKPPTLPRIRVLFDATYAYRQDGTGRYTREILRGLQRDPDLTLLVTRARRIERLPRAVRAPLNGLLHLWFSQVWLPAIALLRQAHIVHTMTVAPWFCPCPRVVTIHDALDFHPRFRPSRIWSLYVRTIGGIGARRASAIVTVSEPAADEIVRHFRIPPQKIHAIWNASQLHLLEPLRPESVTTARYVLFVGDDSIRKNLSTAVAALESVRQSAPALELVVTGAVGPHVTAGRPWITVLGGVTDRELAWLYENAQALIVSSHHEGFGLPLLEALTFCTPVVASDIPALRHIGREAARYAAPDDAPGFASELEAILSDPNAAREQTARAAAVLTGLTWERAAQQIVDVYVSTIAKQLGVAS